MSPTIRTERLTLTPVTRDDLDALLALWRDPDVRRYHWGDQEVPRKKAARILDSAIAVSDQGIGMWAVRVGDEDALAGYVALRPTPAPGVELVAAFNPGYRRRGYATEALRALLGHAFGTMGFRWLTAIVGEPDEAGVRLVERLGFRRTEMVMGRRHLLLGYLVEAPEAPVEAPTDASEEGGV
ncbi:MAG TPA: GNAT family N-acetyltransferase [Longimicrobium sp.]|nr:GNAT family N-acetyltransferase [Longimicrobium sp.]